MDQPNSEIKSSEQTAYPHVVYGERADDGVALDRFATAQAMREIGISDTAITNSAIYIDPKNRLSSNGTHYPNWLGRLRFPSVTELQKVDGDIIRLSTRVRGKERTEDQLNRTMAHELEHLAQADRNDLRLSVGRAMIYGFAALGALAGSRLSQGSKKSVGILAGGLLGHQIGYWIAPHERQARQRASDTGTHTSPITPPKIIRKEK